MKWLRPPGNYSPGDTSGGPPIPTATVRLLNRLAPVPVGTDADLLARFRAGRCEAAFSELVRRHAPAVRAVARARLSNPADAEDVAQATFLVLARDAGRVRESVAGWLVRVAHLTALQHRRNLARRRTDPLPDHLSDSSDPVSAAAAREAAGVVAEELAALPDKLRSVLALCALDGLTAATAAERLGVPKGTVDTRLATAKRRLADRLTRRGLGVASVAAMAAGPAQAGFPEAVAANALAYAAPAGGGAVSPLTLLADGVRPAMTSSARLFAAGLLVAAAAGTAGTALIHARPDDKPAAPKPPAAKSAAADAPAVRLTTETDVRKRLAEPSAFEVPEQLTLGTLLLALEGHGFATRIDLPALLRARFPDENLAGLRDTKLKGFGGKGTTWADLLADATAGVSWGGDEGGGGRRLTYWVSGSRVVIGPAYCTPVLPGSGDRPDRPGPLVAPDQLMEQVVGPPVSVALDGKPLADAVKELRALTGANIVVDGRAKSAGGGPVSGTFDDVRLLTVLQVIADQAGLKPVTLNNVYYLTDPQNAAVLQAAADTDLHGPAARPVVMTGGAGLGGGGYQVLPNGFVSDGQRLYKLVPAEDKPADKK